MDGTREEKVGIGSAGIVPSQKERVGRGDSATFDESGKVGVDLRGMSCIDLNFVDVSAGYGDFANLQW
ncbi:hypothetical protein CUZ56_03043 [Saezia sanguinis]|uniref:Uncharacterized protein n=2 Tax=Saezia sanguinis TaxID=1965230 RepID=A0A433S9G2_9BURK|nr:hypothetical protein CUZ56_03043 [Saezia sanguinis]